MVKKAGGKPYQIIFLPLNPLSRLESIWQRPLALIVVTDLHAKTSLTVEQVQTLIGLTAAEARVTMGLAEGKNLEKIANEWKVLINTARTQLKQYLVKPDRAGKRS